MRNYHKPLPSLSKQELERYSRQTVLPQLGLGGQMKLSRGRVLVVGAGGLGSPVLYYLAAAGVGQIGIADHDTVNISNLQRQILFSTSQKGLGKASVAKQKLQDLNPHISISEYCFKLTSDNALNIISEYDVIVDGTDNFPTRYLLNDACVLSDKPLVYGSVFQFEGQVSVFNQLQQDGSRSANYRDLFPFPPPHGAVPSCSESGVIGSLPGVIGSLQATEAIKILAGIHEHTLKNRLLIFNALTMEFRSFSFSKDEKRPPVTHLIDYEEFCHTNLPSHPLEITSKELKERRASKDNIFVLDVRSPHEYESYNIGGTNIPKEDIEQNLHLIPRDVLTIAVCSSGNRSLNVAIVLFEKFHYENVRSLKGGISEWQD